MDESVYAPPKADLSKPGEAGSDGDNAFYVVSIRKFTLLYFLTLGLYQIFWSYKNWSSYKDRCRYANAEGQDIWPIPRAIFSIFFIHSLFYKVEEYAKENARPLNWNVDTHATLLVFMLIVSSICGRLAGKGIGTPYTDFVSLVLLVPMYFSVRKAQEYINFSCGDAEGISNSQFTGANWAWMVAGAIFWMLALFGLFMPEVTG
jgi:hypothetical protein